MCGIVGVRRFDGEPVDSDLLRRMTACLVHRGPDDEGYWTRGSIGLGHRRLSIIDPMGSAQPMDSPDGRGHLAFNGEIFNYRSLRSDLRGALRTSGDTEVVLALHRRFGVEAVGRLVGQFAYAYFDDDDGDLWLVRDRLGVLPLYYYQDRHLIAFASEIKALVPALPAIEVDEASLHDYLARRSVAAPYTLFRGVRKLRAGHHLRVRSDGTSASRSYWSVRQVPTRAVDAAPAIEMVSAAVSRAVDRALVSDVPVGALLSGGVDSSLIVALASQKRDGTPLDTYSAGFGDPRFDELPFARHVSDCFGTNHHEVSVRPADFAALWPQLTWHRDAPLSEPADVAVYRLASRARESVKVLLSGEGADELFAGYPKYRMAAAGRWADAIPPAVRRRSLGLIEKRLPVRAGRARTALRAMAASSEQARIEAWFAPFTVDERAGLLSGVTARGVSDDGPADGDAIRRMLIHDCEGWLADNLLERGDRMAMAASVEVRPPLLDHELVELAFSLPSDLKVRRGETKWILKQVARAHLPSEIIQRRKVGFRVPLDVWFKGELGSMARERLLDRDSFVGTVMDRRPVERLLGDHERGSSDEAMRIWTLLSLEVWHGVFFGGGSPDGRPVERSASSGSSMP